MQYNLIASDFSNDAKTNTLRLQKIIDECSALGGGKITLPKGEISLATIFLKSNVHIILDEKTKILGSLDFNDYERDEKVDYPLYQDASHSFFNCSMFVAKNCENISITGEGVIDMQSVWDEENIRQMVHRGAKCIAFKDCVNVVVSGLSIRNATDLAVYLAGCENVEVANLKLKVYIDGISPDNCKNVNIHDCDVETGDDGIVFKSSYTLNKIAYCENVNVWNCKVKSRCSAIKFGTETTGGFFGFSIKNIYIYETRITGIAIESVDGAIIDNITIKDIEMRNVGTPLFIHLGKRMRCPKGREVGKIKNITLENITAKGPYEAYKTVAWNYKTFVSNDVKQYPWKLNICNLEDFETPISDWQITSNICGLDDNKLENITLKNIYFELDGGVKEYSNNVPDNVFTYPEVCIYGRILPAKGIYFRHLDGLVLDNVNIETYRDDIRDKLSFNNVDNLVVN